MLATQAQIKRETETMAYLAEAHADWHAANMDRPWDCPLDCGMAESMMDDYDEEPEHNIRCGHCKGYHPSTEDVRRCSQL